jgi:tRNA (mo5U34)-methyltransferase
MPSADADIRAKIESVPNWYHRFEIQPGLVTPGINDAAEVLRALRLPDSAVGLRALDLGTRDGFFAFELQRRGAEVVAIDYMPIESTGFAVARELLGADVAYTQENIYNLRPEAHGTFDLILFLGLLYHLPDPMGALRIVRRLCRGELYLETQVLDNALLLPDGTFTTLEAVSPRLRELAIMQFYPGTSLNSDPTNYWAPSAACLTRMLEENQFEILRCQVAGPRAIVHCRVEENPELEYFSAIASGGSKPAT